MQTYSQSNRTNLNIFGLYFTVGADLLVRQHVAVTLGQGLPAGCRHLDGVGDDGLQNCTQVQAGRGLVVDPLLAASGVRATVQRPHRRCRLRGGEAVEKRTYRQEGSH